MRKHNYVVGFKGEGQCAYGKDENNKSRWVDLLTLKEAKRRLKQLAKGQKAIYKLVETSPNRNRNPGE